MRDLIETFFKCAVIVLAATFLLAFYFAFTDDEIYYESFVPNEESLQAWLSQMEVEEEEALTADALRKVCGSEHASDDGFCTGYMLGFLEGYGNAPNIRFCDNGSLRSADQAEQIFKNFMEDHPQHWKKPRSPILGAALQDAFPCNSP